MRYSCSKSGLFFSVGYVGMQQIKCTPTRTSIDISCIVISPLNRVVRSFNKWSWYFPVIPLIMYCVNYGSFCCICKRNSKMYFFKCSFVVPSKLQKAQMFNICCDSCSTNGLIFFVVVQLLLPVVLRKQKKPNLRSLYLCCL